MSDQRGYQVNVRSGADTDHRKADTARRRDERVRRRSANTSIRQFPVGGDPLPERLVSDIHRCGMYTRFGEIGKFSRVHTLTTRSPYSTRKYQRTPNRMIPVPPAIMSGSSWKITPRLAKKPTIGTHGYAPFGILNVGS